MTHKFGKVATIMICFSAAQIAVAAGLCNVVGHYEGKYTGEDDNGFVVVDVAPDTGILSGKALSQKNGGSYAIGGVVNTDGRISTSGGFVRR